MTRTINNRISLMHSPDEVISIAFSPKWIVVHHYRNRADEIIQAVYNPSVDGPIDEFVVFTKNCKIVEA